MSLIISIYSPYAFKEVILPSVNNADYQIAVNRDQFHLKSDLRLSLEIMDGSWRLRGGPSYQLYLEEQRYDAVELAGNMFLRIETTEREKLSLLVSDVNDPFHALDKFRIRSVDRITIGKDRTNDIVYDHMGLVSHAHASIFRRGNSTFIQNTSPNGIYINSVRIDGEAELQPGDYINIIGLHMVFLGSMLAIDTQKSKVQINKDKLKRFVPSDHELGSDGENRALSPGKITYRRAPRYVENIGRSHIEIEGPPQIPQEKNPSLFMAIGPSITMAFPMLLGCMLMIYSYRGNEYMTGTRSLFMYSGLVMAVSSALIGVMWTLINRKNQKKELTALKELRLRKYSDYLTKRDKEIKEVYDRTARSMLDNYPDVNECLEFDRRSGELWSRNATHEDFLVHRLGMGEVPFDMEIAVPQEKFSLYDDDLAERPALIKSNYSTLHNVPVTVDLHRNNLIGIIGGEGKRGAFDVARVLSAQIAANNCYTDVKLAYLYDESNSMDAGKWGFAKWLPHVWSEDRKARYVASNKEEASDLMYELCNVFRLRMEATGGEDKGGFPKPYYILFVSDQSLIEGEMISKFINDRNPVCGLTTIILAEQYEQLPNKCTFIIENTAEFRGFYETTAESGSETDLSFDYVSPEALECFTRRISGLQVLEVEEGGDIPNSLTFFEMMGIRRPEDLPVRELWAKSRTYDNIRGMLGQKAGGVPCFLDVHEKYHGPHGLVAGTTGSGKSETLQSYILSLAVNYSPDDVAFFIIDYKGGGMANLFNGLPHLAGQISNLSGNQVKRAMISIKSENRRRQRIFTDNGVNNINAYTKMYKSGEATVPVPHLFIIIDEFAELKREEPEFMRELISVAQVGRSLGVHLILATQKPSGTVDDNIWSNSRFRLCLRVQDKQDSNDMLHKPDAAYITQAGRCYLQVGNDEVYELFQSAYSGAAYDANTYQGSTDIAQLMTLTGKVDMTGSSIKQAQKKSAETAWVEQLISVLNKTQAVPGIYEELKQRGIDYPENRYNTARLQDLLHVCNELRAAKRRATADQVLLHARLTGRKLPQQKDHTELDAVRDYIARVGRETGYERKHQLWLPVLRDKIYLSEFSDFTKEAFSSNGSWHKPDKALDLSVIVGQMDDPENQTQMPFQLDFAVDGNVAVCGSIVTGKSTSLQTIAYGLIQKYSPEEVNLYAIDFSSSMMSCFETAPHCGGVMYENDTEQIGKFFNMMNTILEDRKRILHGGNYKQYVQVNGVTMPAIFLMIDNYGAFKQKTGEAYEQDVIRLSREGISNGIYLLVTGGGYSANDITPRVGENIGTVLTLALKDRFEYSTLLHATQISVLPETGVKGRGLAYYGSRILEYQTAVAVEADNDYERMEKIKSVCDEMAAAWNGRRARMVPRIPEKPFWDAFRQLEEYEIMNARPDRLPIGYDQANAAVYGIPLDETFCYGIYGARQTGRTNLMKVCALAAIDKGADVCVIDSAEQPLGMFAGRKDVAYCRGDRETYEYFTQKMAVFQERGRRKRELAAQGLEADEIYRTMAAEFRPLVIFLPDLDQFTAMVHRSEYEMSDFLVNVFSRGENSNIYFFGDLAINKRADAGGYPAFEAFISGRSGIHLGGSLTANTILNFDYLSFSEQNKAEKPGIGSIPDVTDENATRKVVIPIVRKTDAGTGES